MIDELESLDQNNIKLYQKDSIEKIYSKRDEHLRNQAKMETLHNEENSLQKELQEKSQHVQMQ